MLEQLNEASKILEAALNSYLNTYKDIYSHYVTGKPIGTIPRDFAVGLNQHLSVIGSFKYKLEKIQSYAGRCRNAVPSLVPIHTLPFEVLTRIFQLLGSQCIERPAECSLYPPSLPTLMTVCDHWRQVIITSPSLWTHIDLQFNYGYTTIPRMSYAKLCTQRAAQMPLEVHKTNTFSRDTPEHAIQAPFVSFITLIAPRVRSFALMIGDSSLDTDIPVLAALFDNCTPGTLTTLRMEMEPYMAGWGNYDMVALDAATELRERVLSTGLSEQRFEAIFQGVTALQLDRILPTHRWTSSAYHGLVELRITSSIGARITESQFVGVLRQSPGLRILQCETYFDQPLGMDVQVEPIALPDLEVVNLGCSESIVVEEIVRWLGPGSKPLQLSLSLSHPLSAPTGFESCLLAFISHSNITRLHWRQYEVSSVMYLVHHFPQVRALVLNCQEFRNEDTELGCAFESKVLRLETLYVTNASCHSLKPLREVLSLESLGRVVFFHWYYAEQLDKDISNLPIDIRSKIEFVIVPEDGSNPVGEWELFSQTLYN